MQVFRRLAVAQRHATLLPLYVGGATLRNRDSLFEPYRGCSTAGTTTQATPHATQQLRHDPLDEILRDDNAIAKLAERVRELLPAEFVSRHLLSADGSHGASTPPEASSKDGGLPLHVLRSIVKVYVSQSLPNCVIPWQMRQQIQISGSGLIVDVGRRLIVTNAHVVSGSQFVELRKHGDSNNHIGFVVYIGTNCDLALIHVPDDAFWAEDDLRALEFDVPTQLSGGDESSSSPLDQLAALHDSNEPFTGLPSLQSAVKVVGYPVGGEQMSITSGVVSRIDFSSYGNFTKSYLLTVQIDAAINSGNSGGPALNSATQKVIGVAFQVLGNAESIGYIIPIPIIAAFFARFRSSDVFSTFQSALRSRREGDDAAEPPQQQAAAVTRDYFEEFPSLNIHYQTLLNKHFRSYCGLREGQTGVLVAETARREAATPSTSDGTDSTPSSPPASQTTHLLQPRDVLLSINGYRIENDGTIEFRPRERISYAHPIQLCPKGKTVHLDVLRKGELIKLEVAPFFEKSLVRQHLFTREFREKPKYCMFGGLVFSTLTNALLVEWGNEWFNTAPRWLVNLYQTGRTADRDVNEIVVVVQVIPHPVNQSYEFMYARILTHVGEEKVRNFEHFKSIIAAKRSKIASEAAAPTPNKEDELLLFVTVSNLPVKTEIVLPVREAIKADAEIERSYQLPQQNW